MLKGRLLASGLDSRIYKTQFGFRCGRSTEDCIYVTRRVLELAHARRNGKVTLLALDWAKPHGCTPQAGLF